jgi:hypothetical protein
VRGREIFSVFAARTHGARPETEAIAQNLAPHYLEFGRDLEVFVGEPIV